jgi:hypothetical protein
MLGRGQQRVAVRRGGGLGQRFLAVQAARTSCGLRSRTISQYRAASTSGSTRGIAPDCTPSKCPLSHRSAAALANPDPWQGLVDHFTAIAELQVADRGFTDICVYALPPGSATERAKRRGAELTLALCERAQRAGALRPDVTLTDLGLLVWAVVRASDGVRAVAPRVWRRHLALLLDGLRSDAAHPLPGQPLDPERLRQAMAFR